MTTVAAETDASWTCRVCGEHGVPVAYQLYEGMFRSFEPFSYRFCPHCGSMQIAEVPADLSRHYPKTYYSLGGARGSAFVHWVRSQGLRHAAGHRTLVGHALTLANRLPSDAQWLRVCAPKLDARILDVGCGTGDRLREFALAGFRCLKGVDPFVDADIDVAPGVTVVRGELEGLSGEHDLIMLHHSLEHVPAPRETIRAASRLLAPRGQILIRVPVMGCWAWRTYGVDWVQLDPPRHLCQFSAKGMSALAASSGLRVQSTIYDSFELQVLGSENVRNARAGQAQGARPSKARVRECRRQARELNAAADGDQACFVLSR